MYCSNRPVCPTGGNGKEQWYELVFNPDSGAYSALGSLFILTPDVSYAKWAYPLEKCIAVKGFLAYLVSAVIAWTCVNVESFSGLIKNA